MTRRPENERDAALEAELQSHLQLDIQARIAAGADPRDAAAAARREFGNLGQVREVTRAMQRGIWWERFRRDVRYAARGLMRTPGLAIVAVLTLALGIGANTAIFTVVHGVLLKPLPFPTPDRLVYITSQFTGLGLDHFPIDGAEYLEFRSRNRSFADVGAYTTGTVNVGEGDRPARATSARATRSLFTTMATPAAAGRIFSEDDERPNAAPVAVLSWELWQSGFAGKPIVDHQIDVDGVKRTVVGIMPRDFDVHDQGVRIWLPLVLNPANLDQYRGGHGYRMIGRLKPGIDLAHARADLAVMLAQWPGLDGGSLTPGQGVHTPNPTNHPLQYAVLLDDMVGSAGRALWVLQVAVGLVLLIACANLANLLLMRAESRQRELGVRLALGASRGHLVRQFLAEGLVLSLGGAVAGVLLAQVGLHALMATYATSVPRVAGIRIDMPVLLFTLALALGTGMLFGLAPLLHIDARGSANMLRDGGTRTTSGVAGRRLQRGLVVAEIAMAVTLVVGAGLLVRSLWNLLSVDTGFQRTELTTFKVALPPIPYADSMRRVRFFDELTRQLQSVPGITAAAAMQGLPPLRPINANDTQFEGYKAMANGPPANVDYWQWVTPAYRLTMGIGLVAGRDFGPADGAMSTPVLLINQTLANRYYPGQSPLGHRIKPGGNPATPWFTVIGVVKDVKQQGVDTKTGTELYIDYDQAPATLGFAPNAMNVVIRSALPQAALAPTIRHVMTGLDPAVPIDQLRSMDDVVLASVSRPRFIATLLGVFALIALSLAAVGTYGVIAYSVAQRRREIGIRMALGARAGGVVSMVLRQGLRLAAVGIGVGLVASLILSRLVASLLFGVRATDPVTLLGVVTVMTAVAAAACIVPAQRATQVDPVVALRGD